MVLASLFINIIDYYYIPRCVLGIYIGFGLVSPRPPQTPGECDNWKTNTQNFMTLCRSLDISMLCRWCLFPGDHTSVTIYVWLRGQKGKILIIFYKMLISPTKSRSYSFYKNDFFKMLLLVLSDFLCYSKWPPYS